MTLVQQQRLIGAVLLVCVFIAIAFYLISNAKHSSQTVVEHADETEAFVSVIEALSQGDVELISDETEMLVDPHQLAVKTEVETATVITNKNPASVTIDKVIKQDVTAPKVSPTPNANTSISSPTWFLQLASFSGEKNAQAFQKKVADLGYDAKIQSSKNDKGTIYRVRIGPDNNKPILEKASKILNKKLKLKSQIIQNTP